jgi:SAM-dependent methyltransferase
MSISANWELDVGGVVAKALAARVAPIGHVVASDIDVSYLGNLKAPCLEVRRIDVLHDEIETGFYDFVVARALLHHLTPATKTLERMVEALKPGGMLLSIEPDMMPCTVTEQETIRKFWQGWLNWSVEENIDYFIGRKLPEWLDSLGLLDVAGEGHTAWFNGGSDWANYWTSSMQELAQALLRSSYVTDSILEEFYAHYKDPHYWTSVITFTANWGRKPK